MINKVFEILHFVSRKTKKMEQKYFGLKECLYCLHFTIQIQYKSSKVWLVVLPNTPEVILMYKYYPILCLKQMLHTDAAANTQIAFLVSGCTPGGTNVTN